MQSHETSRGAALQYFRKFLKDISRCEDLPGANAQGDSLVKPDLISKKWFSWSWKQTVRSLKKRCATSQSFENHSRKFHEAGRSAGPPEVVLFCELAKSYIFSLRIKHGQRENFQRLAIVVKPLYPKQRRVTLDTNPS